MAMPQERILVVEDEVRVAQALCRVLTLPEGGGYAVDSCDSAEVALERLRATNYDLLVTDLRMSGMSGLELLEQVQIIRPTTRSVLITAYGSPQVEARARLVASAYLPKPFSMKSFVEVVKQALNVAPHVAPRLVAFSEEGLAAIQQRMDSLRADVGALGMHLFDQSGQLLTQTGASGKFDATAFLALLGNTMSAANEVSRILQDEESFDLHFHEGKDYEIYATQVTEQVFLSLIVERQGGASRIGMVWLYLRRAVAEIRTLLRQATTIGKMSLGEELKAGVASALDEALNFGETGPAEATHTSEPSKRRSRLAADSIPDVVETPPSNEPIKPKLRGPSAADSTLNESTQDSPTPPRRTWAERRRAAAARSAAEISEEDPPSPEEKPASPTVREEDLNSVMTYEQARALGLINLDNLKAD